MMEPSAVVDGLGVWVFDSVLPKYEHDAMYAYCLDSLYSPRHLSDHKTEGPEDARFTSILTPEQLADLPTTRVFAELSEVIGLPSTPQSVYINCYDKMSKCAAHVDSSVAGITMLYYANSAWDINWGGETLFLDDRGEIAFASVLRPNRAVVFDSRVFHLAKTPTANANSFKFSIAYKGAPLC